HTIIKMNIFENLCVSKEKLDDSVETEFVEDLQMMSKNDVSEEDIYEESEKEENIIEDSEKKEDFIEESEMGNESKSESTLTAIDEDVESSEEIAVI
ncbi:MAG: hypothetical protein Q4B23_06035, partial [Helcococcus sp.]|nr:hypothetical protein [Helcococcus sp.]